MGRSARRLDPRGARGAATALIRVSGPDEADVHLRVQREACVAAFSHIFPPDRYPFPDDAVLRAWREFRGTVFVADEGPRRVVGIAAVRGCWLRNLYVVPDAWGSGVAGALHDAALEAIPDCPEVRLWVLDENHRARRFYERRGWRPNGESRRVEFPPEPLDVGYTFIREEP
jgi:RimJ/RimL family protein N-acetyltransferase